MKNWREAANWYLTAQRMRAFLILIVIVYSLFLTHNLYKPFGGDNEIISSMNAISAANWVRLGPITLKFAQKIEDSPPGALGIVNSFYITHPNFIIAPIALSFWLFGVGDWQTRVVPIFFSLISLLAFWFLIHRIFKTPWLTVLSSLFYIFFAITIYYGRVMSNEPITLFFILALYLAVILFEQEAKTKYLVALCVLTVLGGLSDWEFFFAAGAVWLYVALKSGYPRRTTILTCLMLSSAVSAGITLSQIGMITGGNPIAFLRNTYIAKTADRSKILTFFLYVFWHSTYISRGYSDVGLILAVFGVVFYVRTYKKNLGKLLTLMLFPATGLIMITFFYPSFMSHGFLDLYLAPFIALMAAWALGRVPKAWLAVLIFFVFAASSLFYTSHLFAVETFSVDDFALASRANSAVPQGESICSDNFVNTGIKFYFSPHQLDFLPCSQDTYFVMLHPQGLKNKTPLPPILTRLSADSLSQNTGDFSFSIALGAEILKSIPSLKNKIVSAYSTNDSAELQGYALEATRIQSIIDDYKLQPIDCSTDLCLYKSQSAIHIKK